MTKIRFSKTSFNSSEDEYFETELSRASFLKEACKKVESRGGLSRYNYLLKYLTPDSNPKPESEYSGIEFGGPSTSIMWMTE